MARARVIPSVPLQPDEVGPTVRVIVRFGGAVGNLEFRDLGAAFAFCLAWRCSPWVFLAEIGQALLGAAVVDRIGKELT